MDNAEGKDHAVSGADLLGFEMGMLVQEVGWDEDVDADLRDDIMDTIDAEMVEEPLEAVDAVVLWWREEDGDVADGLVDLHVGAVHGAQRQSAVHHELHVGGAGCFLAGGGDLLRDVGCGNDVFGGGDVVVFNEDDGQAACHLGIVVD